MNPRPPWGRRIAQGSDIIRAQKHRALNEGAPGRGHPADADILGRSCLMRNVALPRKRQEREKCPTPPWVQSASASHGPNLSGEATPCDAEQRMRRVDNKSERKQANVKLMNQLQVKEGIPCCALPVYPIPSVWTHSWSTQLAGEPSSAIRVTDSMWEPTGLLAESPSCYFSWVQRMTNTAKRGSHVFKATAKQMLGTF